MLSIINSTDYHYHLPEEKIATFPLEKRDEAKLLIYKQEQIKHSQFKHIAEELASNFTLFFNNTRVIPARLYFQKETGSMVEIFLLNPVSPSSIVSRAMAQTQTCAWKCMIGGLKKWKKDTKLFATIHHEGQAIDLAIELQDRENQVVSFSWTPQNLSFAEVITLFGNMPLPPYLNRKVQETDKQQYQTVYAKNEGAVAAPTAGLHFTDAVLASLQNKGISQDFVTLHVGGGTFQPIRTENAIEHPMHAEQIIITQKNLENIIAAEQIAAVGTTSLRTLESLYWLALEVFDNNETVKQEIREGNFLIKKLRPYLQDFQSLPSTKEVMQALLQFMQTENLTQISGETQIMIVPSYQFRCVDALITNFHQPETTLMLLVAAFVGKDWRKIYATALQENYRFLSYGDSSLLFRA